MNTAQNHNSGILALDPTTVGTRIPRSAWIEMLLFFGGALIFDQLFMDGTRFWEMSPHPFWLPVLLISAQYGTSAGLVSVIVSTTVLLLGNIPEQHVDQDYYGYLFAIVLQPLEWAIAALVLGELRRRQMVQNAKLRTEIADLSQREERLAKAYSNATRMNERLETRVAAQLKTVLTIFKAAQSVEQLQVGSVLIGTEELVKELLSPLKFSIYVLNKHTLEAAVSHGWDEEGDYLRRIDAGHDIFEALVVERRVLCAARAADQTILDGQAILAGPIIHEYTGEVLAVLKIEDIGFLDLHVSTISNFSIICDWVGSAYAKAEEYETSQFSVGRGVNRHLMPENTLEPMISWLSNLAFRAQFDLWHMTLTIDKTTNLDVRAINTEVGNVLMEFLRTTDLPFRAYSDIQKLHVLLPATVSAGIPVVIRKLDEAIKLKLPPEQGFPEVKVAVDNLFRVNEEENKDGGTPS